MSAPASTCRSCFANIVWAKTLKGHNIPLDPRPTPQGNLVFEADDVTVRPARTHDLGGVRFVSHFATCPNAGHHRRGRGAG